jgi:hypothetical protein
LDFLGYGGVQVDVCLLFEWTPQGYTVLEVHIVPEQAASATIP